MTLKLVYYGFFLSMWLIVQGAVSNVLESSPTQVNGVLTACADQQISLTCSHNLLGTTTTQWRVSPPVNCSTTINHQPPIGTNTPCGTFMFQGITEAVMGVTTALNSTAVATANVSMTDSVIECVAGNAFNNFLVGNISLCIVGPLHPPAYVSCENSTDGLNITWEAVVDASCAMSQVEYNVTITRDSIVVYTMIAGMNHTDVNGGLQPGVIYNVSVSARTVTGSCDGEQATIPCQTSDTLSTSPPSFTTEEPPTPTQPSMPTSSTPSLAPRAQPPPIVVIVIPIVFVVIIIIILIVIAVLIYCICCRPGRNRGDQKLPLSAHTGEEEHKTESAPVYAMVDKSNKRGVDDTDLPTYQDPSTIQHEQAETGDLYAVADKPKKSSKKDKSEEVLADMYSVPDKTKKSQLTYADIDMGGGSGRPVQPVPQMEYATVVN